MRAALPFYRREELGLSLFSIRGMACGADQAVRIGCDDNSGDFSQAIWAGICELEQKKKRKAL